MSGWVYWPLASIVGFLLLLGWIYGVLPHLHIQSELVNLLVNVGIGWLIGQLMLLGWLSVSD